MIGRDPRTDEPYVWCPFDSDGGDSILKLSGGGAGVGDPRERPAELVQEDVRNGIVSVETARRVYGVVLDPATLEITGRLPPGEGPRGADRGS